MHTHFTAQSTQQERAGEGMTTYHRERHPVRQIPTREQLEAAHRRTVAQDRQIQQPSTHHIGSSSGFHPEPEDEAYELEEGDEYYQTRLPTSARRYQGYTVSPEEVYQSGNTRYHVRYVDVPIKRQSRQQLPPPQQRDRYTEEVEIVPQAKRHLHPVAWFGIFCVLLVVGWIGLNFVTSWYQGVKNDWTYGTQRHFEIDAVVGHNTDSAAHPSHFTAENNNGQIIVIELPAGDAAKAKIYQIETVPGNAGNPPVKLSFADMNGDGKPDMIVMIGDGNAMIYLTLLNNGSQFVSKL
jgi:hypothetical protein